MFHRTYTDPMVRLRLKPHLRLVHGRWQAEDLRMLGSPRAVGYGSTPLAAWKSMQEARKPVSPEIDKMIQDLRQRVAA